MLYWMAGLCKPLGGWQNRYGGNEMLGRRKKRGERDNKEIFERMPIPKAVSYTHLDVYKRQGSCG